jgi:hypothetical protein
MANKFRRWCGFPSIQGSIDGTQQNFLIQYGHEQKKKLALRTYAFIWYIANYIVKVKTKFLGIVFMSWKSPCATKNA